MKVFTAAETAAALSYGPLIEELRRIFAAGTEAPPRQHYPMPREGEADAVLLLMPVWAGNGSFGAVKLVNVTPGNAARGLPAVTASVLLFDETTGVHVALFDGASLTSRRTAAVSALAASRLARPDSHRLLVIGAGAVGSELPAAYRAVLPIERVDVWNPSPRRAAALVDRLVGEGIAAKLVDDLEAAVGAADVISCATLSEQPLVRGAWLRPGQHLDLIGSFTKTMREADDEAIEKGRVFIDTPAALAESGDLIGPIASGALREDEIAGTLYDLCGDKVPGRLGPGEITVFKAVGVAIEDLAAAVVAYRAAG